MSYLNSEIRQAIDLLDVGRARILLRDALKEADAETFYLASQVALNNEQKRDFLKKAIEKDAFHSAAHKELEDLKQKIQDVVASSATASVPISSHPDDGVSRSFMPPVNATGNPAVSLSSTLSSSSAFWIALGAGALTGVIVALQWILGIPFQLGTGNTWVRWVTYPLAALFFGFVLTWLIRKANPEFDDDARSKLILGVVLAWFIPFAIDTLLGFPIDDSTTSAIVWDGIEGLGVAFATAQVLSNRLKTDYASVFSAWILAYIVLIVVDILTPSFQGTIYPYMVPTIVLNSMVANACVAIGAALTIKAVQKK